MPTATGVQAPPVRTRTPLLALLTADGISQAGNAITMLAVPWFVLETTGSAARTGITAAAGGLAVVVAGFFGGALVDRLGHARTSIIGDLASALTVALIPTLYHTVGLAFWQLLVLVFLGAVLDTPGWSARRSLYEVGARLGDVGLERANTWAQMVFRVAGLGGPLLAGVLVAAFGPENVLWIDAASFLVSAGLVAWGVAPRIIPPAREVVTAANRSASYLHETLDGFRFIFRDRLVLWMMVSFAVGNLLAEPIYSVVLPVYANEVFDSSVGLGVVYAGLAIGSLIGNLLFLALAPRLPRRATMVAGFGIRAICFWLLVPLPPVAVVAGAIALSGIFLEPTNPIVMTVFQERVPEAMRGRVFGSFIAALHTMSTVGYLVYGLLLQGIGLRDTMLILAIVNLSVPLAIWLVPALREMDGRQVTETTSG